LSSKPLHVCDGLRDLLTFEGIELTTVRLELGVVFDGVLFFSGRFLDFEYDDTTGMISES